MPLNEATPRPRSGLSREQRQEALAACYGVPEPISAIEQEKFRRLLSEEAAEPTD